MGSNEHSSPKGEHLDLSSEPREEPRWSRSTGRRYLGVHFACCDVYNRVYINRSETAYTGCCPRCRRQITFPIGPEGTPARFFTAE